jgi:hypothetical protein
MADSRCLSTPAVFNAVSTTGMIFAKCAREASSGTTPPYCAGINWLAVWLASILPFTHTAADVSSHEDSMAKITMESVLCTLSAIFVVLINASRSPQNNDLLVQISSVCITVIVGTLPACLHSYSTAFRSIMDGR